MRLITKKEKRRNLLRLFFYSIIFSENGNSFENLPYFTDCSLPEIKIIWNF